MIPRGKRDPVPLSRAEPPDGQGPRGGRRTTSEEDEEEGEEGHLLGLPRDDLAKSMSGSSVSSYHSALCSEGTETFKDCLEFLDEEGTPPPPGSVPPAPGPRARPKQPQLSAAAKNSQGQPGRMGAVGGERQLGGAAAARQPGGMLGAAPSDSDEADGEVRALTARAFRSLSGLPGARLDMCSSHTSSSLSNSQSEDGGRPRRRPGGGGGEPRGAGTALHGRVGWPFPAGADGELLGLLGKEQFECVDVELESGEARKGHCKKRTVPKRQILLKRKERKEMGFGPWGDGPATQPLPPARKEPPSKGRALGEDFRLNYKQFMKTASLDADASKTRAASCLVKNVLTKKMQYEQRIKMEQKGLRGSSTSSGPSSASTDLLGDGPEGKSSSLSRSDCSFSAEDLRGGGVPAAAVARGDAATSHPAKGVVLSEATRESVCKLKKTFNELNERMKYQEVLEGQRLPRATEQPSAERIQYRRARALFEAHSGVGKVLDVAPRFERVPKPWPSLKQRAILPSYPKPLPGEAAGPALPATLPARLFTSRAQEVRLVPQSQPEEKPPAMPREPPAREAPPAIPPKPQEKGKGLIPQPRDVRKLLKSSYSLCFGTAGTSRGTAAPASSGEPPPAAPLVIHCTSVCRQEPAPEPGAEGVPGATSQEPAPTCADGSAKLAGSRPSPTRGSPVHITKVQATRRAPAVVEGLQTSPPPRRERSELRVPPRVPAAEGVPHVETHLHVLVGRRSPAAGGEGAAAQSGPVLRAEKTVLLPPPPSPAEGRDGRGSGAGEDPGAGPAARSSTRPQPEPPGVEQGRQRPGSHTVSAGTGSNVGGTDPTAVVPDREGSKGPPIWLPERREGWEQVPKWPAASEPYLPAAPAENYNYLAIPVKAPKSSPVPKLPSVPSPASASFGTPTVPNPSSASFGTPTVPNPCGTPFGTPSVPSPASASFGTPTVPNPCGTPFGTPSVPSPASTSFGTPTVPNMTNSSFTYPSASSLASTAFGTPLVSNPTNKSFGTPLIPYLGSASFGTPLVPSSANTSFGTPQVPNPSNASFGTPLVPDRSSSSFGTSQIPNSSSASFGAPLVPNPSSSSFGTSQIPNSSSSSFGTPQVPNPSSSSFGTPQVPNPSSVSFGTPSAPNLANPSLGVPLVPNPANSSFGSPMVPNPVPTSLGHVSVSNVTSSSPLVPSLALGSGVCPLPGGEAPWSKPGPEHAVPRAAEGPVPLPPAQPQPPPEDAAQVPRRTDGAVPGSKSAASPTAGLAPHPRPPAHRRMLVDPDSGKCYYMEPPRQPQLKTLYDPETGQYLEVLIPPVASHTGLYQAPFNPLLYAPPYVPYGSFPGLPAPPPPAAPSPVAPDPPAAENPGFSGAFSSAPKAEGLPAAGPPDCGYLESPYYIPTGMRASPGPSQPPASPEDGPLPHM
ncbi:proline-rich basic protein 1 [Colius striatus]|uniref:proline-rich basic protein 1 n=1 Tax=Colius striatus TaxID=57412 RepID=UPI002B1E2FBC|nr:proline-rich basic protein 1 [Colius striatus]